MSQKTAEKHGFRIDTSDIKPIRVATNARIRCVGSTKFQFSFSGRTIDIYALVSPDVHHPFYLGKDDQIKLGMLPPNYPNALLPSPEAASLTTAPLDRDETIKAIQAIIDQFPDVFDISKGIRPMKGPPMSIKLRSDITVTPYRCVTSPPTPLHQQEEAKDEISRLEAQGIIAPQKKVTKWLLAAFFVGKPDFTLRLVINAKPLNLAIYRPAHPFNAPDDCLRLIPPDAEILIVFDAKKGYFQIPLDEDSQDMLSFLLPAPFGAYKYLRAPMGCSASGDEWCARSDRALAGIPLIKIVDDFLIACKLVEAPGIVKQLLQRCKEHKITLSKDKLQIGTEVTFVGHVVKVTPTGIEISAHPDRLKAIRDFPAPTSLQDLRSFLGLAVQLTKFNPDVQHAAHPFGPLKKIHSRWEWLPMHQQAFEDMKKLLCSDTVVRPFKKGELTQIISDASRLFGLGYVLIQRYKDEDFKVIHLIECGSSSLSTAQMNYSTVELEATGLVWALDKSKFHLIFCPHFEVLTDHRPLIALFNQKNMQDSHNSRLQRLLERTAHLNFKVKWIEGKKNVIADALSRAPVFQPRAAAADAITSCNGITSSPATDHLSTVASTDGKYQQVIKAWQSRTQLRLLPHDHPARKYARVWDRLSLHGDLLALANRIVVPSSATAHIIDLQHSEAHLGIVKMKATLKGLYYWPQMDNQIEQKLLTCPDCEAHQPRQQAQPIIPLQASYPWESASCDLFTYNGKPHVAIKDRYSGFLFVSPPLPNELTATIIKFVRDCCKVPAFPGTIRTDNGPQFQTEFAAWCHNHNIVHDTSDPLRPQGNGHAESGVKQAKHLLDRNGGKYGTTFVDALLAWNNSARADGYAPASMFMSRTLRTKMPAMESSYGPIDQEAATKARLELEEAGSAQHNSHAKSLPEMAIGDKVLIWSDKMKTWSIPATVESKVNPRSYVVITSSGTRYRRNREQLRPHTSDKSTPPQHDTATATQDAQTPRRSARLSAKAKA